MCPGIKSQALPLVMDFLQRSPTAFQRSPASSREAPASSRGAPFPPEEPQSLKVSQPSKTASPASTGTSLGGAFHIQGTASICQKLGQEFLLTFLFLGEQGQCRVRFRTLHRPGKHSTFEQTLSTPFPRIGSLNRPIRGDQQQCFSGLWRFHFRGQWLRNAKIF